MKTTAASTVTIKATGQSGKSWVKPGATKKGTNPPAASVVIVQPLWLMRSLQLRYQVQSIGDLRKKRAEQARSRSGSLIAQDWRGFD